MKNILVINAGSSSLKYQLIDIDTETVIAKGLCERIGIDGSMLTYKPANGDKVEIQKDMPNHEVAIKMVLDILTDAKVGVIKDMSEIAAVGHRMVHGGEKFSGSVIINDDVIEAMKECIPLGPLHNPANLMGIAGCQAALPDTPMVGVFDTAWGQGMEPSHFMYALPYELYKQYGVRRYGFHGTSHKYVTGRLGNGSSISCSVAGKCVDTSMGLTPLEGLPMGTRCGSIDPAILPYLMKRMNITAAEMDNIMNKKSGMLGISGVSSDFRDLGAAAAEGNERAQLALDMFVYAVKKYIGAYAAAMGGVDAIVFTPSCSLPAWARTTRASARRSSRTWSSWVSSPTWSTTGTVLAARRSASASPRARSRSSSSPRTRRWPSPGTPPSWPAKERSIFEGFFLLRKKPFSYTMGPWSLSAAIQPYTIPSWWRGCPGASTCRPWPSAPCCAGGWIRRSGSTPFSAPRNSPCPIGGR